MASSSILLQMLACAALLYFGNVSGQWTRGSTTEGIMQEVRNAVTASTPYLVNNDTVAALIISIGRIVWHSPTFQNIYNRPGNLKFKNLRFETRYQLNSNYPVFSELRNAPLLFKQQIDLERNIMKHLRNPVTEGLTTKDTPLLFKYDLREEEGQQYKFINVQETVFDEFSPEIYYFWLRNLVHELIVYFANGRQTSEVILKSKPPQTLTNKILTEIGMNNDLVKKLPYRALQKSIDYDKWTMYTLEKNTLKAWNDYGINNLIRISQLGTVPSFYIEKWSDIPSDNYPISSPTLKKSINLDTNQLEERYKQMLDNMKTAGSGEFKKSWNAFDAKDTKIKDQIKKEIESIYERESLYLPVSWDHIPGNQTWVKDIMQLLSNTLQELIASRDTYMDFLENLLAIENEDVSSMKAKVKKETEDYNNLNKSYTLIMSKAFSENWDKKSTIAKKMLERHVAFELGVMEEISGKIHQGIISALNNVETTNKELGNYKIKLDNEVDFKDELQKLHTYLTFKELVFARNSELIVKNIVNRIFVKGLTEPVRIKRSTDLMKENDDFKKIGPGKPLKLGPLEIAIVQAGLILGVKIANGAFAAVVAAKHKTIFTNKETLKAGKSGRRIVRGNGLILLLDIQATFVGCAANLDTACGVSVAGLASSFTSAIMDKKLDSAIARTTKYAMKLTTKAMKAVPQLRLIIPPANFAALPKMIGISLIGNSMKTFGKVFGTAVGVGFDVYDVAVQVETLIGCISSECSKKEIVDCALTIVLDLASIAVFFLVANPLIGTLIILGLKVFKFIYDTISQTSQILQDLDVSKVEFVITAFKTAFGLELSDDLLYKIDIRDAFRVPAATAVKILETLGENFFACVVGVRAVKGVVSNAKVELTKKFKGTVSDLTKYNLSSIEGHSFRCIDSNLDQLVCLGAMVVSKDDREKNGGAIYYDLQNIKEAIMHGSNKYDNTFHLNKNTAGSKVFGGESVVNNYIIEGMLNPQISTKKMSTNIFHFQSNMHVFIRSWTNHGRPNKHYVTITNKETHDISPNACFQGTWCPPNTKSNLELFSGVIDVFKDKLDDTSEDTRTYQVTGALESVKCDIEENMHRVIVILKVDKDRPYYAPLNDSQWVRVEDCNVVQLAGWSKIFGDKDMVYNLIIPAVADKGNIGINITKGTVKILFQEPFYSYKLFEPQNVEERKLHINVDPRAVIIIENFDENRFTFVDSNEFRMKIRNNGMHELNGKGNSKVNEYSLKFPKMRITLSQLNSTNVGIYGFEHDETLFLDKNTKYVEGCNGSDMYTLNDNDKLNINIYNYAADGKMDYIITNLTKELFKGKDEGKRLLRNGNYLELPNGVRIDSYFEDYSKQHLAFMDPESKLTYVVHRLWESLPLHRFITLDGIHSLSSDDDIVFMETQKWNQMKYFAEKNLLVSPTMVIKGPKNGLDNVVWLDIINEDPLVLIQLPVLKLKEYNLKESKLIVNHNADKLFGVLKFDGNPDNIRFSAHKDQGHLIATDTSNSHTITFQNWKQGPNFRFTQLIFRRNQTITDFENLDIDSVDAMNLLIGDVVENEKISANITLEEDNYMKCLMKYKISQPHCLRLIAERDEFCAVMLDHFYTVDDEVAFTLFTSVHKKVINENALENKKDCYFT